MTFVIPMAGRGARFTAAGYDVPKMLIKAHGKTLLQWSLDSLPLALCHRLVFIGLAEHEKSFGLSQRIRSLYGDKFRLEFLFLPDVTGGQAETVLCAKPFIDPDKPLLVFNIDTAFRSDSLAAALMAPDNDGVLGTFTSSEPRFSFAKTDENGKVSCVKEKEAISNHALTGLYHYRLAGDFLDVAGEAIKQDRRVKGEFYIAPLYNELIARGRRFVLNKSDVHYILGTPDELNAFNGVPKDRIVADLTNRNST